MRLTFLGTDSVLPVAGNDTASYLVDDHTIVDTGLGAYRSLHEAGADARAIRRIFLTHWHHDHFIGLAGLLFGLGHGRPGPDNVLEIFAPRAGFDEKMEAVLAFLGAARTPTVVPKLKYFPLDSGDAVSLPGYQVRVLGLRHAVASLAYRFEEDGARLLTLCGDSAPHAPLADFARGSRLLVHEASHPADFAADDPQRGHSTAREAASLARDAAVGRLALIHFPLSQRAARLAQAQPIFAQAFAPRPGDRVELSSVR
ncbi:MAG: MBL fold metallo-hydrolase [Spirochaetes bacterium]|nr:MBL fold metallo-hydrolase [Spirochaetota bacterium]